MLLRSTVSLRRRRACIQLLREDLYRGYQQKLALIDRDLVLQQKPRNYAQRTELAAIDVEIARLDCSTEVLQEALARMIRGGGRGG